jgi:hypothetical protein
MYHDDESAEAAVTNIEGTLLNHNRLRHIDHYRVKHTKAMRSTNNHLQPPKLSLAE